jgi:hypothetical protein
MTTPEPLPAAPMPASRPFQYSLRTMFGLMGGTAVFFSVAGTLGYADAVVALAAVLILLGVMQYPRRVHLPTRILLTLVAGILLWANLRPTGSEREWNVFPPEELDAVAKAMFSRGWPLRPWETSLVHGMKFHSSELEVYGILALDGVVCAVALFVVRGVCELRFRRRDRSLIETPPDRPPQSGTPLGGFPPGPRLE